MSLTLGSSYLESAEISLQMNESSSRARALAGNWEEKADKHMLNLIILLFSGEQIMKS